MESLGEMCHVGATENDCVRALVSEPIADLNDSMESTRRHIPKDKLVEDDLFNGLDQWRRRWNDRQTH